MSCKTVGFHICASTCAKRTPRTKDLVNVRANGTSLQDRVNSSLSNDAAAFHAPEGGGRGAEHGHGGGGDDLGREHRQNSACIGK